MKSKSEKIFLVISIFILMFYIVAFIGLVALGINVFKNVIFKMKDSITPEKFVSTMKEEGFEVAELKNKNEVDGLKQAYRAENGKYTVEYYTFKDADDAKSYFYDIEADSNSNVAAKKVSISGKNYSTFTIVTGGKFTVLERIDNTVVHVYGNSKHESASKELLKSFGY